MQRQTTKELLAKSFMELARTKPVNKVTVANITENCGMTPPTFYRHFRDKYDLTAWIYAANAQKCVDKIGRGGYAWRDTILDGVKYFAENAQFALNAFTHTSGRNAFLNQVVEANDGFIAGEIRKALMSERIPEELTAMVHIYCYGTGRYLMKWLTDGMPTPPEKVAEIMEACLPEPLKLYL